MTRRLIAPAGVLIAFLIWGLALFFPHVHLRPQPRLAYFGPDTTSIGLANQIEAQGFRRVYHRWWLRTVGRWYDLVLFGACPRRLGWNGSALQRLYQDDVVIAALDCSVTDLAADIGLDGIAWEQAYFASRGRPTVVIADRVRASLRHELSRGDESPQRPPPPGFSHAAALSRWHLYLWSWQLQMGWGGEMVSLQNLRGFVALELANQRGWYLCPPPFFSGGWCAQRR